MEGDHVTAPDMSRRRAFLKAGALAAVAALPGLRPGEAKAQSTEARCPPADDFTFEVTRSEEAWRALLSDEEYRIMREGGTEKFNASPYHGPMPEGTYTCKGCCLTLYSSKWKKVLDMGFVFFRHSEPNAVLTGIETFNPYMKKEEPKALTEVHCRRCGSHLGHILIVVPGEMLHCINGTALRFVPATA